MKKILLISFCFIVAACANVEFQKYEGRSDKVIEGQGGTRESIDGIDLWSTGTPPRKYQVIGVISVEDFDNPMGRSRIQSALVEKIKEQKGDAGILIDQYGGGQMTGFSVSSKGTITPGFGYGKKQVRYEVVKYLD